MTWILIFLIVLTIVLASIFLFRPSVTADAPWKIVAFLGLFVLPVLCIAWQGQTTCSAPNRHNFAFPATRWPLLGKASISMTPVIFPPNTFRITECRRTWRVTLPCGLLHLRPSKKQAPGLTRIYLQYMRTPPDPASIRIPGGYNNEPVSALPPWRPELRRESGTLGDDGFPKIESEVLPTWLPRHSARCDKSKPRKLWSPTQ